MAVRFVEDGYEYLDPVSGASTGGSALISEDGSRSEPWLDRPGYGQNDLIANGELRWMGVSRETILRTRPPVPQRLFPARLGYGERTPLTIEDIFYGDWTPQVRSWTSPPMTQRRAFEEQQQMYTGSDRNVSMSVNPML